MKNLGVQPTIATNGSRKGKSILFDEMAAAEPGTVFVLTQGEDFEKEPKAYAPGVYIAMNRRGIKVRVSVGENDITAQIVGPASKDYTSRTHKKTDDE